MQTCQFLDNACPDPNMCKLYGCYHHDALGHSNRQDAPKRTLSWAGAVPHDPVNHPAHYTAHPSGIECIQITEHMNFNLGNAVKYIWRAGDKGAALQDLRKARWYLDREIARLDPENGKARRP